MTNAPSFLIAGCGVSGRGAARLAAHLKYDYMLADEKDTPELRDFVRSLPFPPREVCFGWTPGKPLPHADQAVLSPGIRPDSPMAEALALAAPVRIGELEFALARLRCPFVGITGTNGKTTVTELTTALFKAAGMRAAAAGNIGDSLSEAVIRSVQGELDIAVVEISSFQLETMKPPHPQAAVILNIASDHMDRYASPEDYIRVKFKLLKGMRSGCIVHHELRGFAAKLLNPAAERLTFSVSRPTAFYSMRGNSFCRDGKELFPFTGFHLEGMHNAENILASLALLEQVLGVDAVRSDAVLRALKEFHPGAHRLEMFLEKDGIRYIDDSKATNPHAVNAALDFLPKNTKAVLILGGSDKDMDFTELIPHLSRVRTAIGVGQAAPKIKAMLKSALDLRLCDTFEDAVRAAVRAAKKGDTVLLSPACASFDMFTGYAQRGDVFQKLVREITSETK